MLTIGRMEWTCMSMPSVHPGGTFIPNTDKLPLPHFLTDIRFPFKGSTIIFTEFTENHFCFFHKWMEGDICHHDYFTESDSIELSCICFQPTFLPPPSITTFCNVLVLQTVTLCYFSRAPPTSLSDWKQLYVGNAFISIQYYSLLFKNLLLPANCISVLLNYCMQSWCLK